MAQADLTPDLCVIGAGSAGLSIAAGAVQMGASVVLIERGRMGGDCLNYGCVPSKALLAAAKQAQTLRDGAKFGIAAAAPEVDFKAVMAHVHGVIAEIAPHDSQERFEGLGVAVLRESARFIGRDAVQAGGQVVRARRFVIATGSRAAAPPIPGLDAVPYLDNESLFALQDLPDRLLIIGGGPIGMEMAQAFRRLGSDVTVLEAATALNRDDPELAAVVTGRLRAEGVDIREGAAIARVDATGQGVRATLQDGAAIEADRLLVAAGRKPVLEDLDLAAAGVAHGGKGVDVDSRLRSTTNRRVFAAGDVASPYQFTHVAGYHAGIVVRNVLFRLPAKARHAATPWCTYTDPELAQVGLTEAAARAERGESVRVLRAPFAENDRARAERRTEGLVKVVTDQRGRVLGAGIAGVNAGELIAPWTLAIARGDRIGRIANFIASYPTRTEASKRAAGAFYMPGLFSERVRKLVRFLAKFG